MKTFLITFFIYFQCYFSVAQVNYFIYKVVNQMHLEGDRGWDYLSIDTKTHLLYISHGTMVQVLDVNSGKLVGTITNTNGVHGIALAPTINKGFISNGQDSSVTVFDLQTLKTITKVPVTGRNPDAILYDPFTSKVFVFNGRSNNATVLNGNSNEVIATIPLSGKPEFSVSDGKGKIYVNIEDKSMVDEINPVTMKVEKEWSVAPGVEPSGLALDNINHRLFSVCDNGLMVIVDAEDGHVISTVPIGDRVDGAAFDPLLRRAFSSNGDGTLTVVQEKDANTFKVLENIITQKGARTVTVDTITHHLYLPTAEFGVTPEPTNDNPHPRPSIKPGSFVVLDVMPDSK
ncbi:MAG: YncE family protein [Chitinophagales bacterium]|nr:YncE family protein [Chitinophagales bacterium]